MLWLSKTRLRIRSLLRRETVAHELDQELQFHLAEQKAEYLAEGMSERDADAAARRMFGSVASLGEECRDKRCTRWLEDFLQDLQFAWRSFVVKSPGFTIVAVLTLALGIGANTAFFSAAYGILLRPLPYPAPERLVDLQMGVSGIGPITSLREIAHEVDYAGYFPNVELNLQVAGGEASRVNATTVTWNLLRVLEIAPARGRWFEPSQERAGSNRIAVLSDRMWKEQFAADPAILGRSINLNEEPFEIVGVMPAGFAFPSPQTELWIPIRIDPNEVGAMWGSGNLFPIGRLRDGATLEQARAEVQPAFDRIRGMFPWRMPDLWGKSAWPLPYSEAVSSGVRPKLFALSAAALLLLLIACGNVGNLLLARAVQREREFAMREALGARRGRLARQLLTENLALVIAGGLAGMLTASLILKSLPLLLPKDTPRLHEIVADPTLTLAAAASMMLTVFLFSIAPLFRLWRMRRESLIGKAVTASKRTSGMSLALIGVELALATTLLIGAGLMARTLWRLAQVDSGFHTAGVVLAQVSAGPSRCATPEHCQGLLEEIQHTLAAEAGIRSVNWSNVTPLGREFSSVASEIQDHPKPPSDPAFVLWNTTVTPGYFDALGVHLQSGRPFSEADRKGSVPVAIISQSTAKRFWPNEGAIGKRLRPVYGKEWRTVVGIVSDVAQFSLTGFPEWVDGAEYVPLAQAMPQGKRGVQLTMFVESLRPQATAAALSNMLRGHFPDVVLSKVSTLDDVRTESLTDQRSTAWLLALLAGLGLLLGIVGVHGVIAHRASQRTREIGIRVALGASSTRVMGIVLQETLLVSLAGAAAGVAAALALSRFLHTLLFGVTTHDTLAFVLCASVLLMAAALAAVVPAVRASHTDPALTLRQE